MDEIKFGDITKVVTFILEMSPLARVNDRELYVRFIKFHGLDPTKLTVEQLMNTKMPSYDTVSRIRRRVQSERIDLIDAKTRKERRELYEVLKKRYSKIERRTK